MNNNFVKMFKNNKLAWFYYCPVIAAAISVFSTLLFVVFINWYNARVDISCLATEVAQFQTEIVELTRQVDVVRVKLEYVADFLAKVNKQAQDFNEIIKVIRLEIRANIYNYGLDLEDVRVDGMYVNKAAIVEITADNVTHSIDVSNTWLGSRLDALNYMREQYNYRYWIILMTENYQSLLITDYANLARAIDLCYLNFDWVFAQIVAVSNASFFTIKLWQVKVVFGIAVNILLLNVLLVFFYFVKKFIVSQLVKIANVKASIKMLVKKEKIQSKIENL
jgi:hypothetical protein